MGQPPPTQTQPSWNATADSMNTPWFVYPGGSAEGYSRGASGTNARLTTPLVPET